MCTMEEDRREELASLVKERAYCREQCEEVLRQCVMLERAIGERDERIVSLSEKLDSSIRQNSTQESDRVELERTQREVEEVESRVARSIVQTREARLSAEALARRTTETRIARARLQERLQVLDIVLEARPDDTVSADIEAALAEEKLLMASAKRSLVNARRRNAEARLKSDRILQEASRTIALIKSSLKDQAFRDKILAANATIAHLKDAADADEATRFPDEDDEVDDDVEKSEEEARAEAALRFSHSNRQVSSFLSVARVFVVLLHRCRFFSLSRRLLRRCLTHSLREAIDTATSKG